MEKWGGDLVPRIFSERVGPTFSVVGWGHFYKILDKRSRSVWDLKTCISTLQPPSPHPVLDWAAITLCKAWHSPPSKDHWVAEKNIIIWSWVAEKNIIICPKQTRSCGGTKSSSCFTQPFGSSFVASTCSSTWLKLSRPKHRPLEDTFNRFWQAQPELLAQTDGGLTRCFRGTSWWAKMQQPPGSTCRWR